ncbi:MULTISPECIES: transcriptional regulator [Acidiplasma]|jgi:putative transcriptional regulator|uniref:Transcriptional regulator n=1 Tax=Acidiplasma aeolicum TaxID=507754 RepID=A0A0N8VKS7_9ARCH|nr:MULTISPECIES: transcriptional regulator [Acidiplasma]KPV46503.1 hypothetical protein SE19_05210 [Acidiplasma aeolicum]KQB34556.1 hypothetical protein AOG54_04410 [Acidiplasma aeolicum]
MKIEQAMITQLMVLLNVKNGKYRPSEISKELGITLQGVVYHMKILRDKGYIGSDNKITKEGFDFLYNGLNTIEDFVHSSLINIDASLIWEAIPDRDIIPGQKVYLYMQDGYLHASPDFKTGSYGVSCTRSNAGKCAGITGVKGLIDVKKAKITIMLLKNIEKIENLCDYEKIILQKVSSVEYDLAGSVGELAYTVLRDGGIKNNLEYNAIGAGFEAAKRGYSTLILISDRLFHFTINDIRELQAKNPEIEINYIHV